MGYFRFRKSVFRLCGEPHEGMGILVGNHPYNPLSHHRIFKLTRNNLIFRYTQVVTVLSNNSLIHISLLAFQSPN